MSSFHFGLVLPAVFSRSEYEEIKKKFLKQKALSLARSHASDSDFDIDDDEESPRLFVSGLSDTKTEIAKPSNDTASSIDGIGLADKGDKVPAALETVPDESFNCKKVSKATIGVATSSNSNVGDGIASTAKKSNVTSNNEAIWHDRIDPKKKELRQEKLKEHIKKMESARKKKRTSKYGAGKTVSSRRKKVAASLPKGKRSDGKKKNTRDKLLGVLIEQCDLDDDTWLVKFRNNEYWYCHYTTLVVENNIDSESVVVLSDEERESVNQSRLKLLSKQHEDLLKPLLFPLVAVLPEDNPISIRNIVKKLKPRNPWLEEKSLREFVANFHKNLHNNKVYKDCKQLSSENTDSAPVHTNTHGKCDEHLENSTSCGPKKFDIDDCSSDFSSDLEDMFDLKKPSADPNITSSSQQGPKLNCSSGNKRMNDESNVNAENDTVARSNKKKRSESSLRMLRKRYPDSDDSSDDDFIKEIKDRRNSRESKKKLKNYLSSITRKLSFDRESSGAPDNVQDHNIKDDYIHLNAAEAMIDLKNQFPSKSSSSIGDNNETEKPTSIVCDLDDVNATMTLTLCDNDWEEVNIGNNNEADNVGQQCTSIKSKQNADTKRNNPFSSDNEHDMNTGKP